MSLACCWYQRSAGIVAVALIAGTIGIDPASGSPAKGRADSAKLRAYLPVEDLPHRPPAMAPQEQAKVLKELTALRERQKILAAPNSD